MIKFRRKLFSVISNKNIMIAEITNRLDNERIYDYEVDESIPKDVISVTSKDMTNVMIYLPKSNDYAQYGIDDFLRSIVPHIRTYTSLERDIYTMKIRGSLTQSQYYRLIKYIIEEEGFCAILDM